MKGVIPRCLAELVQDKYGDATWRSILEAAGQDPNQSNPLVVANIEDSVVLGLVGAAREKLNLSMQDFADLFGAYWMETFAPKYYGAYMQNVKTAADFLLKIDDIHTMTTRTVKDAKPPRFIYKWPNDRTLEITYESERGLIDFAVGLARGVGKYFGENLRVSKLSNTRFQIVFPQPQPQAKVS